MNKKIKIYGECHSIGYWAKAYGLSKHVIYYRYKMGCRGEELVDPVKNDRLCKEDIHDIWGGKWEYVGGNESYSL